MAITGIDTIDGKQIIAAGAVSAKSAEMAYNDENGNPITGYQVAGDYYSASNPSGFITEVPESALSGFIPYSASGVELPNSNFKITPDGQAYKVGSSDTVTGTKNGDATEFVNNTLKSNTKYYPEGYTGTVTNAIAQYWDMNTFNWAYYNVTVESDGFTITDTIPSDTDTCNIRIWIYNTMIESPFSLVEANGGAEIPYALATDIPVVTGYVTTADLTAYQPIGDYYSASNPSGFITGVPAGTMNESAFGYDASDNITAYNGSAIGGGSAPAYDYTDNGLISAIDTSGLYAISASTANKAISLVTDGSMGGNIRQDKGTSTFYYMPTASPWTTATVATGIFSPLQYATGACLAMDAGRFKAYYKGNEWFVTNTAIGQALRGEVHQSRGVHISGATTTGRFFDLSTHGVRGQNSVGEWLYGPAEDVALRAVSSCDMHESAFEYDASDNITGYNGSAFKAGDEFPQSATEAIEAVTANSGAWGGSALSISAGPGISLSIVDGVLIISTAGGN